MDHKDFKTIKDVDINIQNFNLTKDSFVINGHNY